MLNHITLRSSDAFIGIAESIGFRVVSRNTQNTFEGLLLFWAEKYPVVAAATCLFRASGQCLRISFFFLGWNQMNVDAGAWPRGTLGELVQ